MQYEFPFTRVGALQLYNQAQTNYVRQLYFQEIRDRGYGFKPSPLPQFLADFILKGNARLYAEKNSEFYFKDCVENQTEESIRRFNTLEDKLKR